MALAAAASPRLQPAQLEKFYSGSLAGAEDAWAYYSLNVNGLLPGWDLVLQVEQLGDLFSDPNLYLSFVSPPYSNHCVERGLAHDNQLLCQVRLLRRGLLRSLKHGASQRLYRDYRRPVRDGLRLPAAGRAQRGAAPGHWPDLQAMVPRGVGTGHPLHDPRRPSHNHGRDPGLKR